MPSLTLPNHSRRPAPWRLLVVGLLLAALAGWQGGHCANDAMTMASAASVATPHHADTTHHDPPGGKTLAGVCLSVLAAITGALVLLALPGRLTGVPAIMRRPYPSPTLRLARAPALSALGVLRI